MNAKRVRLRHMRPKPLRCPFCGSYYSRVIDVGDNPRNVKEQRLWTGKGLWRRRRCIGCTHTFTTEETVQKDDPPTTSCR